MLTSAFQSVHHGRRFSMTVSTFLVLDFSANSFSWKVQAILFLAPLVYHQMLEEDPKVNRLVRGPVVVVIVFSFTA